MELLSLEDYISKRKREDGIDEKDKKRRSQNIDICAGYVFEYFNHYLESDLMNREQIQEAKSDSEEFSKQMKETQDVTTDDANDEQKSDLECYIVEKKIYLCPFCDSLILFLNVPLLKRKKNSSTKFQMYVCRSCGKHYLYKKSIPKNVNLNDYKIICLEFPEYIKYKYTVSEDIIPSKNIYKRKKNTNRATDNSIETYGMTLVHEKCRWEGCLAEVFKDGLCWEHYQHEMNELFE